MTMELSAMVMFYSVLLGATLPARSLKQGLICFNLHLSGHHSISLHLEAGKPPTIEKEIVYCKLKSINPDQLKSDIENSTLLQKAPKDIDQLAEAYISVLSTIIDMHAPLLKKRVSVRDGLMTP